MATGRPPRVFPGSWRESGALVARVVRTLAAARRTEIVELKVGPHSGRIDIVKGELVAATAGRFTEVEAFHHLLCWRDATLTLGSGPPRARSIRTHVEALIEIGMCFVEDLDRVSSLIGGTRSILLTRRTRLTDSDVKLPVEVRRFAERLPERATLVDAIQASPWSQIDTIKVCCRLGELDVLIAKDMAIAAPPMAAQLAVVDWLLGRDAASARKPKAPPKVPPRKRGETQPTARTSKTQRSAHLSRSFDRSAKHPFDDLDEKFFAAGEALQIVETTDRFEDLDGSAPRKKRR